MQLFDLLGHDAPADTFTVECTGGGGQSFGAFIPKGLTLELEGETGNTLSIFCLGEPAHGVTLEGLKYPLQGATMTAQVPLGVSNEFLGGPARITVQRGTLVVMTVETA